MKILHIINNLGSGGAEKLLVDLIPLLNESNGIRVDILLLTDENNVFEEPLIKKGIKVDIIRYRNMYDLRNILEIKKHIVNGDYDIVHSHIFPTQYWVALSKLILKNKNVKFITTEHSTHNRRRENSFYKLIDKFIYAQYDTIISNSEKTKENLLNWIDYKRKNIDRHFVIENGVNLERIREALPYKKSDLINGVNNDVKLICMVGRFSEAKDQITLIKAIRKLPKNVHLVLVGEGALISNSKEVSIQLGVSDRVHFLGFRPDIPRILKTIDIVVLSSHWEGFGLVAVEGMAAMKPVIVSNVEGLNEIVKDKGLQFQVENESDLANKVKELLSSNELYYSKVNYAQKRCLDFDIKQKVKELENLYKQQKS